MKTPYLLPEDYDRIENVDAFPETDYSRQTFKTYNDMPVYLIPGYGSFFPDNHWDIPD